MRWLIIGGIILYALSRRQASLLANAAPETGVTGMVDASGVSSAPLTAGALIQFTPPLGVSFLPSLFPLGNPYTLQSPSGLNVGLPIGEIDTSLGAGTTSPESGGGGGGGIEGGYAGMSLGGYRFYSYGGRLYTVPPGVDPTRYVTDPVYRQMIDAISKAQAN